jgi:hypothetical protein
MATVTSRSLARMRKALRRHLGDGWQRAVFATPTRDGKREERELAGSEGAFVSERLEPLIAAAEQAARQGYVKHTYVIDERTRIEIDARHGAARLRTLDPEKVMGGKNRPLRPDESGALLRAIGIMNADGSISASKARKYKQVGHMVELCRPTWEQIARHRQITTGAPLRALDLACGNSVLGFVLVEALRLAGVPARLHGVDVRADVIERSRERASALEFESMTFSRSTIQEGFEEACAALQGPIDLVISLHACDTATDEALALAIRSGVHAVLAAPCCQSEVARQLEDSSELPLRALGRHGLLRRDYAAVFTDALRVEALEACGYHVDVLEFVESTHTAKNLLIRARRRHPEAEVDASRWRLDGLVRTSRMLRLRPTLLELLAGDARP